MRFIHPLAPQLLPVADVGGKGAGLSQLLALGFNVPPGFCLSTAAYVAHIEGNELEAYRLEMLEG